MKIKLSIFKYTIHVLKYTIYIYIHALCKHHLYLVPRTFNAHLLKAVWKQRLLGWFRRNFCHLLNSLGNLLTQNCEYLNCINIFFILFFICLCGNDNISFFFFKFYLFMAVLGLRFRARAFSSCGERGPLFIAVRGPLTIAASLVAEHRLQTRRLSNCGSRSAIIYGMPTTYIFLFKPQNNLMK